MLTTRKHQWSTLLDLSDVNRQLIRTKSQKGAVTYAVCPESAWLVTFLIGNDSTGVVTWSAPLCGACGISGKKCWRRSALDCILHNMSPRKRCGRRSAMWPPCSLRRNVSAVRVFMSWRHHAPLAPYIFIQIDIANLKIRTRSSNGPSYQVDQSHRVSNLTPVSC